MTTANTEQSTVQVVKSTVQAVKTQTLLDRVNDLEVEVETLRETLNTLISYVGITMRSDGHKYNPLQRRLKMLEEEVFGTGVQELEEKAIE